VQLQAPKEPFPPLRFILAPVRWLVEKILVLYYVATDAKVPLWAKRCLVGSLLYIFSLGLVLDFLPPFGEVDDFFAFLIAAGAVAFSIKPHHKSQAKETARRWFRGPPPPSPPPSSPNLPALPPPTSIPPLLPPPPSFTRSFVS
jgi:uncharacterized membrane protein YkvA (DUF1232 family)